MTIEHGERRADPALVTADADAECGGDELRPLDMSARVPVESADHLLHRQRLQAAPDILYCNIL